MLGRDILRRAQTPMATGTCSTRHRDTTPPTAESSPPDRLGWPPPPARSARLRGRRDLIRYVRSLFPRDSPFVCDPTVRDCAVLRNRGFVRRTYSQLRLSFHPQTVAVDVVENHRTATRRTQPKRLNLSVIDFGLCSHT